MREAEPAAGRTRAGARLRLVAGVSAAWILAGLLLGAQTSLGTTIQGGKPVALGAAVTTALIQSLPWIPVTLAVIALAIRFPLSRPRLGRTLLLHLGAAVVLAFFANVRIVLGFWASAGMFAGWSKLAKAGATWATVNFHVAVLIYAAILGITQYMMTYRRTRARELQLARVEGQLARARLQALNAQIRPHFLFNTLHTIGQLWRSGRSDEADAVLDGLGALFHRVQSQTGRIEIPLGEELELVREYLAIEQARFRDRLRPTIKASDDALAQRVPPLILQPIVENAVRHGVSALSTAGCIAVTASVADARLRLVVSDDGPGMGASSSRAGSGTGLRNTRERIAQLYGGDATLRIDNAARGGTIVTLDLPLAAARGATADAALDE
jgi:signal transduction histidine kinase